MSRILQVGIMLSAFLDIVDTQEGFCDVEHPR